MSVVASGPPQWWSQTAATRAQHKERHTVTHRGVSAPYHPWPYQADEHEHLLFGPPSPGSLASLVPSIIITCAGARRRPRKRRERAEGLGYPRALLRIVEVQHPEMAAADRAQRARTGRRQWTRQQLGSRQSG